MIELTGITKVYRTGSQTLEALRGVTMMVRKGEFISIMGPSGSGKSTLMNVIGCLDTPTAGEYVLDGERVAGLDFDELAAVRNHKIGFVFQNFNLLPYASAWENVELPMLFDGKSARRRKERVTRAPERRRAVRLARAQAVRAFRRATAEDRPGPGPGQRPAHPPSRRADREPRFEERRGDHRPALRSLEERPDHRHGHPQRRYRRPVPTRRPPFRRHGQELTVDRGSLQPQTSGDDLRAKEGTGISRQVLRRSKRRPGKAASSRTTWAKTPAFPATTTGVACVDDRQKSYFFKSKAFFPKQVHASVYDPSVVACAFILFNFIKCRIDSQSRSIRPMGGHCLDRISYR